MNLDLTHNPYSNAPDDMPERRDDEDMSSYQSKGAWTVEMALERLRAKLEKEGI